MARLIAESVAIVGSILLAFAIDAWWEERLERNDELQQLERLLMEFEANIERFDNFLVLERALSASLEIFHQMEEAQQRGEESIEVAAGRIALLSIAPTYEANSPVLDGLIRSGRLEIIQDGRVINALAAWERTLRDYAEVALVTRNNGEAVLIPALARRGDIGSGLIGSARVTSRLENEEPLIIGVDTEIKGLIAQKVAGMSHAGRLLESARMAGEDVMVAIQEAIPD